MSGRGVLIWAEVADAEIASSSIELLAMGRRLAADLDGPLSAVVLGTEIPSQAQALIARGADRVYFIHDPDSSGFHTDVALAALTTTAKAVDPAVFLFPHSNYGSELAPRLAFRLKSAPAMGCTDGRVEGGTLLMTRPCYGGKALAVVSFRTAPAIATIRPKSVEPLAVDNDRQGDVVVLDFSSDVQEVRTDVLARTRNEQRGVRLDEANIVLAGGRGLGGPHGFAVLEELAEALGAAVGASRPACDLGWYPQSCQVGISGKTVAPELYIAVGISGAGQHMAGCGGAKVLVAINSDPEAAIFSFAHIGIVSEYQDIIPEILKVLRR